MAEMGTWDKEIDKLSLKRQQQLLDAFRVIMSWSFFDQEYKWTGYRVIAETIKYRMQLREAGKI